MKNILLLTLIIGMVGCKKKIQAAYDEYFQYGQQDGYQDGYEDFYQDGVDAGWDQGFIDFASVQYLNGLNDGQNSGFNDGFSIGYINGEASGIAAGTNAGQSNGFNSGYNNGFNVGYNQTYNSGYNDGNPDGFQDGLEDGFGIGYNAGYGAGYNVGDSDGFTDGYNDGYNDGYWDGDSDGYWDGVSDSTNPWVIADAYNQGYQDGWIDGNVVGYNSGYNDGFIDGEIVGYNDGYNIGFNDGDSFGFNSGYNHGFGDGYDLGYNDGWFDAGGFTLSVANSQNLKSPAAKLVNVINTELVDLSKVRVPTVKGNTITAGNVVLFSDPTGLSKDLEKRAAMVEKYLVFEMAKQIRINYELAADRSLKLAVLANHWRKLSTSRAVSNKAADDYTRDFVGARVKEIVKAYESSLQGDNQNLDQILTAAAELNGTTPENISKLMSKMFF